MIDQDQLEAESLAIQHIMDSGQDPIMWAIKGIVRSANRIRHDAVQLSYSEAMKLGTGQAHSMTINPHMLKDLEFWAAKLEAIITLAQKE